MADTIITTLRLIGARTYVRGLRDATDANRNLGRASQAATPGMKLLGTATSIVTGGLHLLTTAGTAAVSVLAALTTHAAAVGIEFNASMEMSEVGMTTLLKNAKLAKKTVEDVRDFALTAPLLDVKQAVKSTQMLIGAGFKAKQAVPTMRTFSDTLSAMGRDPEALQRMTYAFVQMMSKGQISAEELRGQLGEIFPASKLLARGMGISMKELSDKMKKGSLKGRKYIEILMTEMNKEFKGGTKRAADTFTGMWNNIKETGKYVSGLVFMPLFEFLRDKLFPQIEKISEKIADWAKGGGPKRLIGSFKTGLREAEGRPGAPGVGGKIGRQLGVSDVIGQRESRKKGKDKKPWFERALQNVAKFGKRAFDGIKKGAKGFLDALKPAQPFVDNVLLPLLKGLGKGALGGISALIPVVKVFATVLGWIGEKAKPIKGWFEKIGFAIGFILGPSKLLRPVGWIFQLIGRYASKLIPVFIKVGGWIAKVAKWFWRVTGAGRRLTAIVVSMAVRFTGTFSRIVIAVGGFVAKVIAKFAKLVGKVIKFFWGLGKKIAGALGKGVGFVITAVVNFGEKIGRALGEAIWNALPGPIKKLLEAAGGVLGAAWSKITGGGDEKKRAVGGPISGMAIVGERGPELADFGGGGFVHNDRRLQALTPKIPKLEVRVDNHLQWRGREVALAVAGDTSDRKARR